MDSVIALTGGTGFLGHRLVAALRSRGHSVRLLVRDDGRTIPEGVEVVRGELEEVTRVAPSFLDGVRVLVHMAALGVQSRDRDWTHSLRANAVDALAWLREAQDRGVSRAVVTGTCLEYQGHGRLPEAPWGGLDAPRCTEDSPLECAESYGATKAAGGLLMRAWSRESGFALRYLRLASLYGRGDDPAKVIPQVARALRAGETLAMSGSEQVREWLQVEDAVEALCEAIERPQVGVECLNVGTGIGVSLRGLAERVAARVDGSGRLDFGARPYRPGEVHHLVMDVSHARRALGWSAGRSLDEGILELLEAS